MWAVLAAGMNRKVSFNGTFSTTSASSPVTSSTCTIVHPGPIAFDTIASDGGTPQYSKNAGAYANITEGLVLSMAGGDTLAVKAALTTSGFHATFNIRSRSTSGSIIESVTLTKS
jgi:hypothetical protein